MKANELNKINKLYFSYQDVARVLNISEKAATVTCARYVRSGILIRLKRNLYIMEQKWNYLTSSEIYEISNILQVPSYISLVTALSYYEYTTQIQQNFYESIVLKRTMSLEILESVFNYSKIKKEFYFGFKKKEKFFIAEPEKALIDALYLQYLGRYKLDLSAISLEKFDFVKIEEFLVTFPVFFKLYLKRKIKNEKT